MKMDDFVKKRDQVAKIIKSNINLRIFMLVKICCWTVAMHLQRKVRILLKFNGEPIPRRNVFIFSTFY